MTIDYICGVVRGLIEKYDERRPERLVRDLKILLRYEPMGKNDKACKGFFIYQSRQKLITINSDLDAQQSRIILAHELGHAQLHLDEMRRRLFHDFSMYDGASKLEYEANLFAAELLLDDDEVVTLLNEDDFFFSAAKRLEVPPELLDFKFRILKHKGYAVESPIIARGDFLKGRI